MISLHCHFGAFNSSFSFLLDTYLSYANTEAQQHQLLEGHRDRVGGDVDFDGNTSSGPPHLDKRKSL